MAQYEITKAEAPREFTVKNGDQAGQQSTMQKITMKDAGGQEFSTILFGKEEAFQGDAVEAQMGDYNTKYKNYAFTIKSIKHCENPPPNKQTEPTVRTESGRSDDEILRIVRQSVLKVVGDLFSGKGNFDDAGTYIALAETITEWVMTGKTEPRISAAERAAIVTKFEGNIEAARQATMRVTGKPFLHMLTAIEMESVMMEDAKY